MKVSKSLILTLVFLLLFAIIAGCTQAPPKNQTKDQTENPKEDKKDAEVGEDKPENKKETPPQEGKLEGPMTPQGVKDGTYEGKTDKDERGNYGVAKVTVAGEKITEVEYTEYTQDNKAKSKENGYDYKAALDAIQDLPAELKAKQDIDKIDTYSGATGTTNKFKTAAINALKEGSK